MDRGPSRHAFLAPFSAAGIVTSAATASCYVRLSLINLLEIEYRDTQAIIFNFAISRLAELSRIFFHSNTQLVVIRCTFNIS
jgi:hypothetical protein